jgi:hypothetical protein
MRIPGRSSLRLVVLTTGIATLALLADSLGAVESPEPEATRDAPTPSCDKSCRGLGVEKVQAGHEHCGLIPRERKDEALDAACRLADSQRDELRQRARENAEHKCSQEREESACLCRSELRSWQNVYTHVLSQNCWTECGWAFLIDCGRRPAAGES